MLSVVLTRSPQENAQLEKVLLGYKSLRFNYIHLPLLEYQALPFSLEDTLKYKYIIITSKQAANLFTLKIKNAGIASNLPSAFVVGTNSAKILQAHGIKVNYIANDVQDLIQNVPTSIHKASLYLSGNIITSELPKNIDRKIIYNVRYLDELGQKEEEALKSGVDYILLYSENCAKTLAKLVVKHNLIKILENATVIGISLKVVKNVLQYLPNVVYCHDAKQEEIIKLLVQYAEVKK